MLLKREVRLSRRMKIGFGLGVFLFVFFLLPLPVDHPAMADLEPQTVRTGLALFATIATLWMTEALPLAATALLVPVLGALLGLGSLRETLPVFAHPLILVFLGGFALASALSAQGLDLLLARKLSALGRGKFMPTALLLFSGTAFLSMWMSNTATAAMMIPLAIGLLGKQSETETQSSNTQFLLLGLAYSASIGGLGTIVGSPPNGIAAKQLGVSFAGWMKYGIPAVLILLPLMVGILFLLLRPENREIAKQQEANPKHPFCWNRQRCITLAIFGFIAGCWIFSKPLSGFLNIADFDSLVAILAILLLLAARVVSWQRIEQDTEWGVLLLFGGGLAISAIMKTSGTSLFLARLLGETVAPWPMWGIVCAVLIFVIFLTELSSNTAAAALLVPIFYSMATELDLNHSQLIIPLALASSCAFMLPIATPPNAIIYATGKISQPQMIRSGGVLNLVFVAALSAYAILFIR